VPTSAGGYCFKALAQLVNFDGQAGESQRLTATDAMFLDQSTQLGVTVQGGSAQPSVGGDRCKGDVLARPGCVQVDVLDQIPFSHTA
jgi:hypothetical protein